jgi:predicted metal-dependent peptidase
MNTYTPEQLISRARTALILDAPFFGSLAMRLHPINSPDTETLSTNGRDLKYNATYIQSITPDELKGVMAHEVMHCASQHHTRRGNRDPQKWNRACDMAINPLILDAGFQLPPGGIDGERNKAAEEIYNTLGDGQDPNGNDQQQQGTGSEDGNGPQPSQAPGTVEDAPGDAPGQTATPAQLEQEAADWKIATTQAAQQARAMGKLPGGIEELIKDILEPAAPWTDILREFINKTAKNDYRWTPPNRRHAADGIYFPSTYSESIGKIIIAVDTSGSIDEKALSKFGNEINEMLETIPGVIVNLLYCDASINRNEEYARDDLPVTFTAYGRGGTSFIPVFDYIEERGEAPACLIYFTDGHGAYPDTAPEYPVLWALTEQNDTPFGENILIN